MATDRGRLIVVEGLDRAGKSTQVERLVAHLSTKAEKVEKVRFPDRSTAIGQSINNYLTGQTSTEDHVIHLLFSANRWEAASGLREKLESGTTLVVDRYSFSGAVYSAAKRNPALDLDWAWNMEIGLPKPDLVLFLTVSPAVQAARGGFGEERYESNEMQVAVRGMFERLWERYPGLVGVVDGDGSLEDVEGNVKDIVDQLNMADRTEYPLEALGPLKKGYP